eukprot:CAMPEP_0177791892 /NCGR_PEP_ID=MMETSP0491_2-20121128/24202_1 /TAXON_ID=63592 /ORGANISM="Tetraselmis chuii, Strain PLY429" /LENGTH=133 /DNA_ID=CAMNT_0019314207 /DNA_START=202 /DNA_END=601 /DNA_ORIENTATION=+
MSNTAAMNPPRLAQLITRSAKCQPRPSLLRQALAPGISRRVVAAAAVGDETGGQVAEEDGSVIVQDDMDAMIEVLPPRIRNRVINHPHRSTLLEVILDVGRRPEARFLGDGGSEILCEEEISWEDLESACEAL